MQIYFVESIKKILNALPYLQKEEPHSNNSCRLYMHEIELYYQIHVHYKIPTNPAISNFVLILLLGNKES